MKLLQLLGPLTLSFALAAAGCGDDNDNGNNNGNGDDLEDVIPGDGDDNGNGEGIKRLGMIMVEQSTFMGGDPSVSADAVFWSMSEGLPDDMLDQPLGEADSCTVLDIQEPGDIPGGLPDVDIEFTFIDAGEQIELDAGGDRFATLEREELTGSGGSLIAYTLDEPVSGTLPDGLTATVPGNEFPAFEDVAMPTVAAFELDAPAPNDPITPDTTFTWEASNDDNATVTLDFSAGGVFVTCTAADDGSFSIPQETRDELPDSFEGNLTGAARQSYRVERDGDAALILQTATSQDVGLPF